MAKRYGDVEFVADGQTYTVRYGNLAWDELKRKLGADSEGACLLKASPSRDPAAYQLLLREGLAAYHPELTPDQVRELYDALPQDGQKTFGAAAFEAIALSLPGLKKLAEATAAGPKAPRPRPRQTRKHSTAAH